jgi:arsenate reductase
MAEAFTRKYAGDRFEVCSAGFVPTEVNPLTIQVMKEVGIDISAQRAKGVREFLGRKGVHVAIIVCERAEAQCPSAWPGAMSLLEWPFPDPAALEGAVQDRLDRFRGVRDQIEEKIKGWLAQSGS